MKVVEKTKEIFDIFAPVEGINTVYYGKIRNGKTYAATADILDLLNAGEVVYANWNIEFQGYDQKNSIGRLFWALFFPPRHWYKFSHRNLHFLDTSSDDFLKKINDLVGVHLFLDEGQWIFNSHSRADDVDKRRLILEGGHYCRTLNIITQRPTNIFKDVRSQVHIWYECRKVLHLGSIIRFVRYSIEDMKDDLPVEPEKHEKMPPLKAYWGSSRIFNSYNTHGRRSENAVVVVPKFMVYEMSTKDVLLSLRKQLTPMWVYSIIDKVRGIGA